MKQASLGLGNSTRRTRTREFLAEMERVVPWATLVALVAPFAPEGRRGRPPFSVETMPRIRFMQQRFTLSDPAMEESLHDMPLFREFADAPARVVKHHLGSAQTVFDVTEEARDARRRTRVNLKGMPRR
jgi:hypothetical protein